MEGMNILIGEQVLKTNEIFFECRKNPVGAQIQVIAHVAKTSTCFQSHLRVKMTNIISLKCVV